MRLLLVEDEIAIAAEVDESVASRGAKLDEQVVGGCLAILQRGEFAPHALGTEPIRPAQ